MERLPYLLTVVLTILILMFFNSISHAQTSFNVSNKTTGDTLLTIDNDGDVGIGTTTPAVKFDLRSEITDDHGRLWLGNSDLSHFLRFFSGRQNSPHPGILWNQTDALRFGTSLSGFTEYMRITNNGYLGIGTTSPTEMLEVADTIYSTVGGFKFPDQTVQATAYTDGDGNTLDQAYDQGGAGAGRTITADNGAVTVAGVDGLLSTGTFGSGVTPPEGGGTRMLWYPRKSAFRAGYVNSSQWNDAQIGNYSTALGYGTIASGQYSTAIGINNTAGGLGATALGANTSALATSSTAMGNNTIASGINSLAIGREIEAAGNGSVAIALSDQNGLSVSQDSTMSIMGGNVGIGTITPTEKLEVADTIYSSVGGFKFPDQTVQTTAATGGAINNTLDQAYDQGGAGAGRTITASSGAVNIAGTDGLTVNGNIGIGTTSNTYPLTILPGTSVRGIDIDHNQTGSGTTYGTYVDLRKSSLTSSDIYGGEYQVINNNGAGSSYGLNIQVDGTSTGPRRGVLSYATGPGTNFGLIGTAHGSGGASTTQYGVYGSVTGDGTRWAGYFDGGNVHINNQLGIGTTNPISALSVGGDGNSDAVIYSETASENGRAFYGYASNTGDFTNYGGYFRALGNHGRGIYGSTSGDSAIGSYGLASGANGTGVYGSNTGQSGFGVRGIATSSVGPINYGGHFIARGPEGRGVYGLAMTGGNVTNYGGYFEANGQDGRAVYGEASNTSGLYNIGGYFVSYGSSGRGVFSFANGESGMGVYGQASGLSARAIQGSATNSGAAKNYGGYFTAAGDSGIAVYGRATNSSPTWFTYGGYFLADHYRGIGVYASGDLYGGQFLSTNIGVDATATGVGSIGVRGYGEEYDFYADNSSSTDYGSASSRRWKNNIVEIDNPLQKINRLRGVYFDWDEEHGGGHDVGCIAEEVGAVLPEIVVYEENGIDADGMDYSKLTPLLIEAVKAQQKIIEELKDRIEKLENKN